MEKLSGYEKLQKEKDIEKYPGYNQILTHIKEMCEVSQEYNALVLQEHKNYKRMWQYVTNEAKKIQENGCTCAEHTTVFGWCDEYFGIDDKEEIKKQEEKEKAQEEARKKKDENKKDTKEKKKRTTTRKKKDTENKANTEEKNEEKKQKQMSIFDI